MNNTSNNDEKTYKFKLEEYNEEEIHNPNDRTFSFYQICQFPINKRYSVRKLIYNEEADMLRYSEKTLDKEIIDKFLKKSPEYKYTIYPSYNLTTVSFPDSGEILMARSQILNNY